MEEKLTMEKINAIALPENLKELKSGLDKFFAKFGKRTVDEWIMANVNNAVESGNLVGLTDREKYIFGLATVASVFRG